MRRKDILATADVFNRPEVAKAYEDSPTCQNAAPTKGDITNTRCGRCDVMRGGLPTVAIATLFGTLALVTPCYCADQHGQSMRPLRIEQRQRRIPSRGRRARC